MKAVKNTAIQICNETIHPGEALSLALPLPNLFSCAPFYMPIRVIHGKNKGPCLLITAAMHGNELNGTEIINRLVETKLLKRLQGTLIAVPVLNVYGLINRSRYLPGGKNLDASFPGSKDGTHASRMADLFTTEIFEKADHCIDLQTGYINHSNLPQVYVDFHDTRSKELANVFNTPVISNIEKQVGSLHALALKHQKTFIRYEAGEAMRFDEHSIKIGMKGIIRVMKKLGMLPEKSYRPETALKSFMTEKSSWIHAPTSGITHSNLKLGQLVKKGDLLCVIKDPFSPIDHVRVTTQEEAIIVGKNNLPLVHEGESLFQLAVFPGMEKTASHLEEWKRKSIEALNHSEQP